MAARFRLRHATAAAHARLDDLFSRFDLSIASGYVAFLCAQAPAFLAVERALDDAGASALIDGWTLRRRSDALRKDLADLGQTLPPGLPAPVFVTEPQILGAAYVLEGSRLGGAMLARQVSSGLPVAFLTPAAPSAWRDFVALLDERLNTADRIAEAASTAIAVFSLFEHAAHRQAGVQPS
jgi:heme oxygenase